MTPAEKQAHAAAKRLALTIEGITGVDWGFAYRGGIRQSEKVIRFHVARKRPTEVVARGQMLPKAIMGVPCDVLQAEYRPHCDPQASVDPLALGISIGNAQRKTTGSLGAIVRDRYTGAVAVLSCWHVLFGSPNAAAGEAVVQPGPAHGGGRKIGELLRATDLAHGLDAALAKLDSRWVNELFGAAIRPSGIGDPEAGVRVVKVGAITGFTHAVFDGEDGSFLIDYSAYGSEKCWMNGFRLVPDPDQPEDEISLRGDSGSVWVEAGSGNMVGLTFSGEDYLGPTAEFALVHPIRRVLAALRVDLVTNDG
jgi:hypothetical protein